MDRNLNNLICLASCAVNGNIPTEVDTLNVDAIYGCAAKHFMGAAISMALESAGLTNTYTKAAIAKAQRKAIILNNEMKEIIKRFETAGIWYMPLKGAILKDYP